MGQLAQLRNCGADSIQFPGNAMMASYLQRMVRKGPILLRIQAGPCAIEILESFNLVDDGFERIEFSSLGCHVAILKPAPILHHRDAKSAALHNAVLLESADGSSYATIAAFPPVGRHVRSRARRKLLSGMPETIEGHVAKLHPVHDLIDRFAREDRSRTGLGLLFGHVQLKILLKTGPLAIEGSGDERVILGKSIRMRIGDLTDDPSALATEVNHSEIVLTWPGGTLKMYPAREASLLLS